MEFFPKANVLLSVIQNYFPFLLLFWGEEFNHASSVK